MIARELEPTLYAQQFCNAMLPRVSRTFALGIMSLPLELRTATTVSYLLCRIADTIEDQTTLSLMERRRGLRCWQHQVLEAAHQPGAGRAGVPVELMPDVPLAAPVGESSGWPAALTGTTEADAELLQGRKHVLTLFATLPQDTRHLIGAWVFEMAEGMAHFAQADGHHPIRTLVDLERYCYYVAGTVGHILTGIFLSGKGSVEAGRISVLRQKCERFGIALQVVNIIKDAAGDLQQYRCFLPQDEWSLSLPLGRQTSFAEQAMLRDALLRLLDWVPSYLHDAQAYLLALPSERREARQFCALALHLALLTVRACRVSKHLADAAHPVKITRGEVAAAAAWVQRYAGDDQALAVRFGELV